VWLCSSNADLNDINVAINNIQTPIGLDRDEAAELVRVAVKEPYLGKRIARISGILLGRPYAEGSLGGGPGLSEEFRADLNAFDCVTFIEVVLAFALARTSDEFIAALRRIRYREGVIEWSQRNHYMVDWATNNEQQGFVRNLSSGPYAVEKTCTLGLIAGLPARTTTFWYLPAQTTPTVADLFEVGDLMLFVSTRETLDVFHTGLLVERQEHWMLRHATRSAGMVIEQELSEFMGQNEMAGIVLLRPLC
jgi:hypothetical protein